MNSIRTVRRPGHAGTWRLVAVTVGLGLALSVGGYASQGESGAAAADGAGLFKTHCASCHGSDATGNGPVAPVLRHPPADLTLMARKNGGMFPTARVRRIILGWDIESHGDREMPVWGDPFTLTRGDRSGDGAETRIAAIVRYLETIQRREGQ